MSALERLSAEVRRAAPELSEAAQARQRARFVSATTRARSAGTAARWLAAALVVGLLIGGGFIGVRGWRKASTAAVEAPASSERWWSRVEQRTLERVSDRGELTLEPSSAAHLVHDGQRVDVVLERGEVASQVVPKRGTQWGVRAGAYLVQAVGTRFSVQYEPAQELLLVRVNEGSVQVSGGQLGVSSVRLQVGEALTVVGSRVSIERSAPSPGEPASANELAEQPRIEPDEPSPAPLGSDELSRPRGATVSPEANAPEPTWLELQASGEYARALEQAKRLGFEQLVGSLPCGELGELADAARLARDAVRAERALLQLRARCGASPSGLRAAFLLGRLSDEQSPGQAASWYEKYLAEAPGDRFTEQALGRLISAEQRAGHADRAKSAAVRYLHVYPSGGYAELARSLVQP